MPRYMRFSMAMPFPLAMLFLTAPVPAMESGHAHAPYAEMQTREVKTLSEADIEELRRGGGWGLALPAELNGVPGPAHLLELQEEIPLKAEQVETLQALHQRMREEAIPAGERLIEAERALEQLFLERQVDEAELRARLAQAEAARTELRFVHLSRHLDTLTLLSDAQIERYNALRGYTSREDSEADPCDHVPAGHSPEHYRKTMGCE
ncbi:hypothetical protein [Billgrantia saliphila]|uniref:hypothetical protein n=1 Tax=Billgrantia saliphila TaxID=1848458 RepID=UPI0018CC5DB4|nr:hypothetical protein [Halomonas saliphila]